MIKALCIKHEVYYPLDEVIFYLNEAKVPDFGLSIMHLCPDIRRRVRVLQQNADEKEQVYGVGYLVLNAPVLTC